ncbi:PREDICTED: histone deacetylase 4-like [Priapulus caudatus]|uniref:Histone deacetylase n=1 Tax=Priapulus caudatus TaxID=37621 RepID=A0ABM1EUG7_PRICU|nr:PREDICTED: histone deacetylase 4-like [Priapulus caudatus]
MADQQQQQQQAFSLKQQQQLQQHMLLQQFEAHRAELAKAHEAELAETLQTQQQLLLAQEANFFEQQQKLAEEKRRVEAEEEKLERIKHKGKHEQSAVASSEVKQRLQEFVLSKRQRDMSHSQSALRSWAHDAAAAGGDTTGGGGGGGHHMGLSPPYKHPLLGRYDSDFPLRKTASEPNLKVRSILKHKVIERRNSPLLTRRKAMAPTKRKAQLALDADGAASVDSEPSSPVQNSDMRASPSSVCSLEGDTGGGGGGAYVGRLPLDVMRSMGVKQTQINDALYASPSLPNISLGRPHSSTSPCGGATGGGEADTEADVRAMAAARYGMPLTSHVLPGAWPYYPPSMPLIEGETTSPPTSPATYSPLSPPLIVDAALTRQARLQRSGLKPLSRTHSAPLPLQHPLLQQQQDLLLQREHYLQEKAYYDQQQLLKRQQIRQAILSRCNAKKAAEADDDCSAVGRHERQNDTIHEEVESMSVDRGSVDGATFASAAGDVLNFAYDLASVGPPIPKPVTRAFSSPLAAFNTSIAEEAPPPPQYRFTTGLTYDSLMLKHQCTCGNYSHHPEHGGRLQSIWARLQETGLAARCERVRARKATLDEIQTCHTEAHALFFGTSPLNRQKIDPHKLAELPIKNFVIMPCGGLGVDSDTSWNELHTGAAARMAAGCVIELAMRVGANEVRNGFAIVRPPGHHAEAQQAMGFCFFNNVVIAARALRSRAKLEKVLVLDWDIHHGNGTQQMTYADPHVLYISLHRHDNGNFFPGTGAPHEVGVDDGVGFNVNIAFSGALAPPMSDAEYLAAFRTVIMPIAREFDPEVVLVSGGFDATAGHPPQLGGYEVSAAMFGHLTREVMTLARGRVVIVLEGGYNLPTICDAAEECVRVLLGDAPSPLREGELTRPPNNSCQEALAAAMTVQAPHWPSIKRWAGTIGFTHHEAEAFEREEAETVSAFASLSMVQAGGHSPLMRSNGAVNTLLLIPEKPMEEDDVQIISNRSDGGKM